MQSNGFIKILSKTADIVPYNDPRTEISLPGIIIKNIFEKYKLPTARIASRSYYTINKLNQIKHIGKEEFTYKFIFITSSEERCISKIYNSNDELLAYKFYDKFTKNQFYVGQQIPKNCLYLIKNNCNYQQLQDSIRAMEIEKLRDSIPFECAQRKSETCIIMHAYQIIGQKKKSYILPINNNEKKDSSFYMNLENIHKDILNEEFIKSLHLTERETNKSEFIILPLKINHHYSILVINLIDSKIYCLDSSSHDKFGQFHFINLLKYNIQRYETCAYFMEAMCIVLSQYEHVSNIVKECQNGIFVVKTLYQFGLMFEQQNERTIILSNEIDNRYHEITINTENGLFKYKIKKILSNSKFFNFKDILNQIDPESQYPNKQYEIEKLDIEFSYYTRIRNLLNVFHNNINKEVDNMISKIQTKNLSKHDMKHLINDMQNECQLKYKTLFNSILILIRTFKKAK